MNDEIDGGVDVGMDHGGETELRVGVPLWTLLLESDSTLTSMAWFPETCNQYQHNLSEAESASLLASEPAVPLERTGGE